MKPEVFLGPLVDLAAAGSNATPLPTELRIFPRGPFETEKGPFCFDERAAALVFANLQERGVELPFDYNHGMTDGGLFGAPDPANAAKAAGWFKPQLRDGAFLATDIRWTPAAAAAIQAREWRYTSPTFAVERDKDGNALSVLEADGKNIGRRRVAKVLCVALTNTPAMHDIPPITNRTTAPDAGSSGGKKEGTPMKTLLARLGLDENANETQAVAAFDQILGASRKLMEITEAKTEGEALGIVSAWQQSHKRVEELNARVYEIERKTEETQKARMIEDAIKAGRLTPSQRAALEMLDVAGVEKFIANSPPLYRSRMPEPPKSSEINLSAEELDVCAKHHLDPAKMLESKKKAISEGRAPSDAVLAQMA